MRKLVDDGYNATTRHDTALDMVFNGHLVTPRKREHARFAVRSETPPWTLGPLEGCGKNCFLQQAAVDDHP